jgi:hypothetical protein
MENYCVQTALLSIISVQGAFQARPAARISRWRKVFTIGTGGFLAYNQLV